MSARPILGTLGTSVATESPINNTPLKSLCSLISAAQVCELCAGFGQGLIMALKARQILRLERARKRPILAVR
jgi:hypothetical protein